MESTQSGVQQEALGRSVRTTGLVHDAYLRLIDASQVDWQDRAHFFALSATTMRRILVDAARSRRSAKRGGRSPHVPYEEGFVAGRPQDRYLVALDAALYALAEVDARKAQVVELRYFGGLSVDEAAEVLRVSPQTIMRDWRLAKAWLAHEMGTDTQ